MNDLAGHPMDAEYVERLIDQAVADPNRVDDVKMLLRHKMTSPKGLEVVEPSPVQAPAAVDEADEDDLWDNVPV